MSTNQAKKEVVFSSANISGGGFIRGYKDRRIEEVTFVQIHYNLHELGEFAEESLGFDSLCFGNEECKIVD